MIKKASKKGTKIKKGSKKGTTIKKGSKKGRSFRLQVNPKQIFFPSWALWLPPTALLGALIIRSRGPLKASEKGSIRRIRIRAVGHILL